MLRRWLPALALVTAAVLLAPAPAQAQMSGFRRGLIPIPALPFGVPYVPFGSGYNLGTNPSQYTMPLPSDFLPARRPTSNGLTGRPRQKIEDFEPAPKGTPPAADA